MTRTQKGDHHVIEVRIDRDRCMGSGNCVFWAPDAFELDDEGISRLATPRAGDEAGILRALAGCPVGAIAVLRDGVAIEA